MRVAARAACLVAVLTAVVLAAVPLSSPAWGQASPCPAGQPTGRPPGVAPDQPAQPSGRPPGYPPGECNLALSRSAAARGQTVHATGAGFAPAEAVTIGVADRDVGVVNADAAGAFAFDFVVPFDAPTGRTEVRASGASRTLRAAFEVEASVDEASRSRQGSAPVAGAAGSAEVRGTALSSTGSRSALLAVAGVVLVLAGSAIVVAVRRRRA